MLYNESFVPDLRSPAALPLLKPAAGSCTGGRSPDATMSCSQTPCSSGDSAAVSAPMARCQGKDDRGSRRSRTSERARTSLLEAGQGGSCFQGAVVQELAMCKRSFLQLQTFVFLGGNRVGGSEHGMG